MKNGIGLAVALLALVVASPAFAGDGQVPGSTLKSLGLGQMKVLSDVQGMHVRGMSSNAQATSLNLTAATLYDPNTGSTLTYSSSGYARATAENAGWNATSSADVQSVAQQTTVDVAIQFNGNVFSAHIGGFGTHSGGWAFAY